MRYEDILRNMLEKVPSQVDKREGSIIYDALAPAAAELAQMYIKLEHFGKYTFCDEATGEYLTRRCSERGINRKEATRSIRKGEFNIEIPEGSEFECEGIRYISKERIGNTNSYKMVCQEEGVIGNRFDGQMIPIDSIAGLESASLTDILIPGEDIESDDSLRKRYFESLESEAFGGNIADYKEKTKSIDGIGGVKVEPVWNGGGTVKLVIIDSDLNVPSDELVDKVQETIDPDKDNGTGVGLAPIGHRVTVEGAVGVDIDIATGLTLDEGFSWDDVYPHVLKEVNLYITELKNTWEEKSQLVLRISQIESAILKTAGVIDVSGTTINNLSSNKILSKYEIPVIERVRSI